MPHSGFDEKVRLALYAAGTSTIKLGNVTFWITDREVTHDIPTELWDSEALTKDLLGGVLAGYERAKRVMGL